MKSVTAGKRSARSVRASKKRGGKIAGSKLSKQPRKDKSTVINETGGPTTSTGPKK
ncbi:MAG: hypothetical protein ONB44_04020 [candidate division KSB1 bacterium]|nr:hypothetical protein [candidate division KSB1 bacterium]MDZ7301297.1 hypothetical protein [candidate division KSB1 bacterium]MDZ7310818.1 hypothetical protein [candidate division KSB1 bacterium]